MSCSLLGCVRRDKCRLLSLKHVKELSCFGKWDPLGARALHVTRKMTSDCVVYFMAITVVTFP